MAAMYYPNKYPYPMNIKRLRKTRPFCFLSCFFFMLSGVKTLQSQTWMQRGDDEVMKSDIKERRRDGSMRTKSSGWGGKIFLIPLLQVF